jgi:hypothetical protein
MNIKKMRQHRGKFDGKVDEKKRYQAIFGAATASVASTTRPITLPQVGGPTLEEIEAKYGPIRGIKKRTTT